jgi:hypothetical protein
MTDKMRPQRQKTSRRNRWILISTAAVLIILIPTLAYISNKNQQGGANQPTIDSSTYFTISNMAGIYEVRSTKDLKTPPGDMVLIKEFGFNFTPVGGNAHDVIIFVQGNTNPPLDMEGKTILNGTSTWAGGTGGTEIALTSSVTCYRQSDGTYPLPVRIRAREDNGRIIDGWIALNFTVDDLVPMVVSV